jgi:hypothetical protein
MFTTKIPFQHGGSDYEVRCISDGHTIRVRAFHDGKPANGYEYSVTLVATDDLEKLHGVDVTGLLIEDAKRDVTEGTWERYLKAVKESEPAESSSEVGC